MSPVRNDRASRSAPHTSLWRPLPATGLAALAVAVFVSGMLVGLKLTGRARAALESRAQASKHHPPLLQKWQVFGPLKTQGNAAKYAIRLIFPGVSRYRVIEQSRGVIPAMMT